MNSTVRTYYELACPRCRSDGHINIKIETWATLSMDGTEPYGDHRWDRNSLCYCSRCNCWGHVSNFHIQPAQTTHESQSQ